MNCGWGEGVASVSLLVSGINRLGAYGVVLGALDELSASIRDCLSLDRVVVC